MLGCNSKKWKFVGFTDNHEVVLKHVQGSKLLVEQVKLIDDASNCTFIITGQGKTWIPTSGTVRKVDSSVISETIAKLFVSSTNMLPTE